MEDDIKTEPVIIVLHDPEIYSIMLIEAVRGELREEWCTGGRDRATAPRDKKILMSTIFMCVQLTLMDTSLILRYKMSVSSL